MKKIAFLLPVYAIKPVGGVKVVLEYANRFAADGYEIHIFYPMNVDTNKVSGFRLIKRFFGFLYFHLTGKYKSNSWFKINKKVSQHLVWNLSEKRTEGMDVYIATGIQTLYELEKYKKVKLEDCIYFIQGFEDWVYPEQKVYDSYSKNIKKIVIAPWLYDKVYIYDDNVKLIPNGFDFSKFYLKEKIDEKNKYSLATIYHNDDVKRCCDAIAAIEIVHRKIPQINVTMFGIPEEPKNLPSFITYIQAPSQERLLDIYNKAAIYVAASRSEGMALPPAEAMQCGCALVCTDIGGFALYAKDRESALINKVFDVNQMANNIELLIRNDDLRYNIAQQGNELIKSFTWEKSYNLFKSEIENL